MAEHLIIHLARLGDMIQANHMLLEWKALQPEAHFDVLALAECQAALTGLPLRNVFLIPSGQWKPMEDALAEGSAEEARAIGRAILGSFPLSRYDRILNVDFCHASCWFNTQITAQVHMGGRQDRAGGRVYDDWGTYFKAVAQRRHASQMNLVDLLRSVVHSGLIPGVDARPPLAAGGSLAFGLPAGRRVAVNPGANEPWRRWSVGNFIQLVRSLHQDGLTPLLVGSPGDREICREVAAGCGVPVADFSGRTSVQEMVTLLRETELLISNDTGAVHLAAAAGTRVLGLYERVAYFFVTAPWSAGNVVLHCPSSGTVLSAPLVRLAALERLGLAGREQLRQRLDEEQVEAWETGFLPPGADPLGGLTYLPLHGGAQPPWRIFGSVLRHLLARDLCGGSGLISLDFLRRQMEAGVIPVDREDAAGWERLRGEAQAVVDQLQALAELTAMVEAAAGSGGAEEEVMRQAVDLAGRLQQAQTGPADCPPLQLMMAWLNEKLQGSEPLPVAERARAQAREFPRMAAMLAECLDLTLRLVERADSATA